MGGTRYASTESQILLLNTHLAYSFAKADGWPRYCLGYEDKGHHHSISLGVAKASKTSNPIMTKVYAISWQFQRLIIEPKKLRNMTPVKWQGLGLWRGR